MPIRSLIPDPRPHPRLHSSLRKLCRFRTGRDRSPAGHGPRATGLGPPRGSPPRTTCALLSGTREGASSDNFGIFAHMPLVRVQGPRPPSPDSRARRIPRADVTPPRFAWRIGRRKSSGSTRKPPKDRDSRSQSSARPLHRLQRIRRRRDRQSQHRTPQQIQGDGPRVLAYDVAG